MKVLPYRSTASLASFPKTGGAGCGNVHDKMLPPSQEESNRMFKHTPRPKTVSLIGGKLPTLRYVTLRYVTLRYVTLRYVMNKKNVPLLIFFCFIFLMFQVPFNPNSAHDIWTAIRGNGKSVLLLDAFEKNVSFKRMKSH